jgi:hypothetical protein
MKESTLQILITARALLEQAERDCQSGDRYLATGGLIVLQDAVELVFLAVLIEKDVDQQRAVESMSFDEMIAAICRLGIRVPKSGTLKAMNKLRVTAKHYGQIMEPLTVQGHLNAAKLAIDVVLQSAVGKPLREVFLTELVGETKSRPFLDEAVAALSADAYLESLIATRKAFFLEFEWDYCLYDWRNHSLLKSPPLYGLLMLGWGGRKAPYYTRDTAWIQSNVITPFDYVQINLDTWRIDAVEWGINTPMLDNIRRLTPDAVQLESDWYIRQDAGYTANSANRENASACLDQTIEAIRRKQGLMRAYRAAPNDKPYETPAAYIGQPIAERPKRDAAVVHTLAAGDTYHVRAILTGFDAKQTFYRITCTAASGQIVHGYVERIDTQPLEIPDEGASPSALESDRLVEGGQLR